MLNLRKRLALEEGIVGLFALGGAIMAVVCFGLTWLFSVAGVFRGTYTREPGTNRILDAGALNLVPITLFLSLVGLLVSIGAILYGIWSARNPARGSRCIDPNARVVARYAYSAEHEYLSDDWQWDNHPDARFYVKLDRGPEGIVEYECRREVFDQCGEGLWGTADVQGRWLGGFAPQTGRAPDLRADQSLGPSEIRDNGLR